MKPPATHTADELLRQSLESGDELRLLDAFMLVAWMRGLERIAVEAECDSTVLFLALSDSQQPDMRVVRQVAERLGRPSPEKGKRWSAM